MPDKSVTSQVTWFLVQPLIYIHREIVHWTGTENIKLRSDITRTQK
jgi:hypothetical protein